MNHRQNEDDVRNDVAESLISGLLELELGKRQLGAAHHEALEAVSLRRTRAIAWLSAAGIILALAALATVMLYQPNTGDAETPAVGDAEVKTAQAGDDDGEGAVEESASKEEAQGDVAKERADWPELWWDEDSAMVTSADSIRELVTKFKDSKTRFKEVLIWGENFDREALKLFTKHFQPERLEIEGANLENADLLPLLEIPAPLALRLQGMPEVNDPLIFLWAIMGEEGGAPFLAKLFKAQAWCSKIDQLKYYPIAPDEYYFMGSPVSFDGWFGGVTYLNIPIRTFGRLVSIDNAGRTPRHSAFEKLHTLILRPSDDPGISDENMEELFNNIVARDPRSSQLPTYLGILSLALEVNGGALSDEGMEYLTKGMIVENKQLKEFSISRADKVTMESLQKLNVFTFPALECLYLRSIPGLTSALLLRYKADTMSEPSTLKRLAMRVCSGLDDDGLVGIEKVMPSLEYLDLTGTMGPTRWRKMPNWSTTPHVTDAFCRGLKAKLPKCEIIGPYGNLIETQFLRVAFKTNAQPELNKRPVHLFLVRKSDQVVMELQEWTNHIGVSKEDFFYQEQNAPEERVSLPAIQAFFTESGYLAAGEYELIARHPGKAIANFPVTIKKGERAEILFDWANAKDAESPLANPTLGLEISLGLLKNKDGQWPSYSSSGETALVTSPADGHWIATPKELEPEVNKAAPLFIRRWSIALNAALDEVQVEIYPLGLPAISTSVKLSEVRLLACNWNGEKWKFVKASRGE